MHVTVRQLDGPHGVLVDANVPHRQLGAPYLLSQRG